MTWSHWEVIAQVLVVTVIFVFLHIRRPSNRLARTVGMASILWVVRLPLLPLDRSWLLHQVRQDRLQRFNCQPQLLNLVAQLQFPLS